MHTFKPPPPVIPWEIDKTTGEEFVHVPDVCGPLAWGMLHRWAEAVRDDMYNICGEWAVQMARAMHDQVNWHLSKPIQDADNLRFVAGAFVHAADSVGGPSHPEAEAAQSFIGRAIDGIAPGIGLGVGFAVVDKVRTAFDAKGSQARNIDAAGDGDFVRERVEDPGDFDDRSFRTVVQGDHRIVIGCPVGEWDADTELCSVGTRTQTILHPRDEEDCLLEQPEVRWTPSSGQR